MMFESKRKLRARIEELEDAYLDLYAELKLTERFVNLTASQKKLAKLLGNR